MSDLDDRLEQLAGQVGPATPPLSAAELQARAGRHRRRRLASATAPVLAVAVVLAVLVVRRGDEGAVRLDTAGPGSGTTIAAPPTSTPGVPGVPGSYGALLVAMVDLREALLLEQLDSAAVLAGAGSAVDLPARRQRTDEVLERFTEALAGGEDSRDDRTWSQWAPQLRMRLEGLPVVRMAVDQGDEHPFGPEVENYLGQYTSTIEDLALFEDGLVTGGSVVAPAAVRQDQLRRVTDADGQVAALATVFVDIRPEALGPAGALACDPVVDQPPAMCSLLGALRRAEVDRGVVRDRYLDGASPDEKLILRDVDQRSSFAELLKSVLGYAGTRRAAEGIPGVDPGAWHAAAEAHLRAVFAEERTLLGAR